jgi:RNA polymerase sigma-70 factor (ECF subfamily)
MPISSEGDRMRRDDEVAGMRRLLVERATRGDHDAFADLVRASTDRLYAVASLILRDSDRAEDAVQEALVAAWRDVHGLRDPEAWDAWLYRLTVRACYRAAQGDRRRRVVELRTAPTEGTTSAPDPTATFADRDHLSRALGLLPLDQRAVLVTHFYLGLPISHAASVLGIPVGTCKSRLARGLDALRSSMESDAGGTVSLPLERPA